MRQRLQLRRPGRNLFEPAPKTPGPLLFGRAYIRPPLSHNQLQRIAQLLFGDEAGGVNRQGFLKLRHRGFQQALIAQLVPAVHVHLGGLKAHPHGPQVIEGVARFSFERALVVDQGGVVIFLQLRLLTLLEVAAPFGAGSSQQG